jgi:hypothetical protein
LQKFMRGHLDRRKVILVRDKYRIRQQLNEISQLFSPKRREIMETLQVALAYRFRRSLSKIKKQKQAELEEREQRERRE